MLLENNSYRRKLNRILICCLSSSLLITGNVLPISALGRPQNSKDFIIAKSPDERQPEAVKKAIEQIPVSQASVSPRRKPSVESPIQQARSVPSKPENPQPTSNSSNTNRGTRRQASANQGTRRQTSTNQGTRRQTSTNQETRRQTSANRGTRRQTSANRPAVSQPMTPTYKEINFADVALGILSKSDFQSQGRYFHFYEFEGRENQLVQIRLIGSNDTRRSNNLSLNPLLFLHDPDNNIIVKKGTLDKSSGGDDAFIFARLPAKGTYKIAVTSQEPGEIGRYSLALRNDRASYTLDESGQLSANSSTLKQNGGAYNISNFQGKKNQLVSIRVDSVDEEFSPYVALLNSQGQSIAIDKDKDNNGVYSALIDRARLPEDDTYYIVVTSKNPKELGKYRLTIF
ncbi:MULTISPECIES: pre-peptidase C-terminal domain-containing protein [Nostoc]|uniref:Pre-peptidase C-terminal domain-containing protein n=2 Tax=Nostoc TaxID=1177 RepID=A0ABR8I7I7_9NOSO|nr:MULTISPECIES: pre-peptidase C-terminal domain-containing protein [Nostoc]MBD2563707.1 pre-peptidase C-terminal domain-containing protein [Nostoc linckia FACHB-391]MBD2647144.1 pre-peptidase C-terminal domain-containing protein [Nostoc foliaceum FACHB-393]